MPNTIPTVITALALISGCTTANRVASRSSDSASTSQDGREQFQSAAGLTVAIIHGPVEFRMGSPENEIGRNPAADSPDETQHTARIPRSYAISTHEVTVAQFRRFLDAHPEVKRRHAYPDDPARMDEVMR